MASSRKWKSWPGRFAEKVESTSGMLGLISGMAAVTGLIFSAPAVIIIGGIGVGSTILHAGYRSLPPKLGSASQFLGQRISLDVLKNLDMPLIKLAVIGASQSGKTTFLSTAQHLSHASTRTNSVQAEVLMLPSSPPTYIALLDADGKEFIQQFEILKEADIIILFLDHNLSSSEKTKSNERLAEHDRFIEQIEPVLRRRASPPKVHLLFNKRDLWESQSDSITLMQWFDDHVAAWKRINITTDLTASVHSNKSTDDTAKVMNIIKQFVKSKTAS